MAKVVHVNNERTCVKACCAMQVSLCMQLVHQHMYMRRPERVSIERIRQEVAAIVIGNAQSNVLWQKAVQELEQGRW
jgi:hypothetical protein